MKIIVQGLFPRVLLLKIQYVKPHLSVQFYVGSISLRASQNWVRKKDNINIESFIILNNLLL